MKYSTSTMKGQCLVVVLLAIVGCFGAFGAIGGYDYCGKPCTERSGIVCAYNQRCFTYFKNICEMRQTNCDSNERFATAQLSSCLLGSKCK